MYKVNAEAISVTFEAILFKSPPSNINHGFDMHHIINILHHVHFAENLIPRAS